MWTVIVVVSTPEFDLSFGHLAICTQEPDSFRARESNLAAFSIDPLLARVACQCCD